MSMKHSWHLIVAICLTLCACEKEKKDGVYLQSHAYLSGKDLEEACRSNDQVGRLACVSYIYGVADSFDYIYAADNEKWLCDPPQPEKLIVAYINAINAKPELRNSQASAAVVKALEGSYAENCKNVEIRGAG